MYAILDSLIYDLGSEVNRALVNLFYCFNREEEIRENHTPAKSIY